MNLFDYIDGNSDLVNRLKTLTNPVTSLVTEPIDALKKAAVDWYNDYQSLYKIPDSELSPELVNEKNSLLNRGKSIMDKIRVIGITGDTLSQNLGFVPIIAAGVISTAAGLMLYWTYDFIKFKDKMIEYKTLRQSGYSPEKASQVVNTVTSPPGFFDKLEGAAKYGAMAVGGIALFYFLKKNRVI